MLATGDVDIFKVASSVSRGKHSLHCIIEHEYMARDSLHFLRVQLQPNTTGWFSAGSAPLICLVCLHLSCDFSAVSSSAHYLLQLFPRSDFFFTQ